MQSKMVIGLLMTALLSVASGLPGNAGIVDFDSIAATGFYTDVTPGGARGPYLVFADVTFDGGVVMSNAGWNNLSTTPPNLYGTSDYHPLADNSLLPGKITAVFNNFVSAFSFDLINGSQAANFAVNLYDAGSNFLVSFIFLAGDYGSGNERTYLSTTSLPGGVKKIEWLSFQGAGNIDFAIDTFNYTQVPLPGAVWLLGSGLLGLASWRRFRKG
jgi:hypothetical protein